MNRDDAEKIARRILDRVYTDNNDVDARIDRNRIEISVHLSSLTEEIMAGMALVTVAPRRPEWTDEEQKAFHERRQEREPDLVDPSVTDFWANVAKGLHQLADPSIGLGGSDIWIGIDPAKDEDETVVTIVKYDANKDEMAFKPLHADDNPHGYAHDECSGIWTQQQMIDAGYRNDLKVMRYLPAYPPKATKESAPISGDYAVAMCWSESDLYAAGYTPIHHFLLGVLWEPVEA